MWTIFFSEVLPKLNGPKSAEKVCAECTYRSSWRKR